jgi:phenol hydroxylase P0 protein
MNDDRADLPAMTRYVRIRQRRTDGYVVFDFSIGDPALSVELMLQQQAFESFCAEHRAVTVSEATARYLDHIESQWRYGQPGLDG